ncbi:LysM peptidoglycan-binding domain-containing protein [Sulfuriflexus sp.]|uniref:LysM peptidoglycan-binding domain-containing protein n=1 Tax=Sulfuriflexus sp. TaxID=2015443 RepID=UPI0028CF3084|nr:LysM peptidoglycan-binding domain-containing protein [Sulfuriflexus sp.]MDT8404637.1 LysM peptidoglycan-binding domain-containing protein [Sulfuriflexus sp.]
MKKTNILKNGALGALVLSVTFGCASTQQEEPAAAPAAKKDTACQAELAAAEAARKKAASVGGEWRDTGKILKSAKKALAAGDVAECIKLANKARRQGEMGYAQALEQRDNDVNSYTVERGDNLWNISGKDSIYGDPYQWPLIYKANRSQIKDADLIYPGQDLSIDRAVTSAAVNAAVQHAKTRGAWALGVVEESDKAYLAR